VLEGYGLTETSPVVSVNRPGRIRLGTVGEKLADVEWRLNADGEICLRGPSIFSGYWNQPGATADVFDEESWFHTGDIGEITDGFLRITDRKKDLLVLANGKKVAPQPIELMLAESIYIEQVVLVGDSRKAVAALIVPCLDAVRTYAAKQNLGITEDKAILESREVLALFRREIDLLSGDLADFEKIRKFSLVKGSFTVEGGELTPTLKVKRNIVAQKYASLVE